MVQVGTHAEFEVTEQNTISGVIEVVEPLLGETIINVKVKDITSITATIQDMYEDFENLFKGFEYKHYQDVIYATTQSENQGHDRQEFRQMWVVSEPE